MNMNRSGFLGDIEDMFAASRNFAEEVYCMSVERIILLHAAGQF